MRINMPVTQRNHPVPEGTTIVTRTDAKGRIEYANDAFVSISGFTREELLGQPHNLVRHPDMPAEAFRDMWATLKRGRPWSGLVKNRRKDGDHYWVRANANPLPGGGYHSVRTAPAAQEIAAAEALYARMRQDASLALHEGSVIRRGTLATLRQQWRRVRISHRFGPGPASPPPCSTCRSPSVYGLMQARDSQDRIYSGNLIPALQLGTLAEHLDGGHTALLLAMQALPGNAQASAQPQLEAARANRSELEREWAEYGRIASTPDEQALARAFEEPCRPGGGGSTVSPNASEPATPARPRCRPCSTPGAPRARPPTPGSPRCANTTPRKPQPKCD
ncbi:PAS domain-containing protein [Thauera humireducens]|uniref:PAS domain-containing protein n=1 Tax=Thauera humireducens TaxID=1134435 RepID=UPI00311DBC5A